MDDKRREHLQKQHQAIHADVEALASRVQELLSSVSLLTKHLRSMETSLLLGTPFWQLTLLLLMWLKSL